MKIDRGVMNQRIGMIFVTSIPRHFRRLFEHPGVFQNFGDHCVKVSRGNVSRCGFAALVPDEELRRPTVEMERIVRAGNLIDRKFHETTLAAAVVLIARNYSRFCC